MCIRHLGEQHLRGGAVADVRARDHHVQQQAEGVDHDVPLAPVDQLAAVEAAAVRADDGVSLDRLRVDHAGRRLRIPPHLLADPAAQPVVELTDQGMVAPAAEERINPVPRREVRRHRPPLDAVVHEIAHRVQHGPVAVRLRLPSPAPHPARHRQERPDHGPLRIRHVRGIPPNTLRMIGRVPEPVSDAITRRSNRVELHRREHVQLRQQGLLDLGRLRNPELPRGPVAMPAACRDHPIETPVRRPLLKIGKTTAS